MAQKKAGLYKPARVLYAWASDEDKKLDDDWIEFLISADYFDGHTRGKIHIGDN